MARTYKKITYEERIQIKKMINEGIGAGQIAKVIGVHRGTMYNELERGGGTRENKFYDYDPDVSQRAIFKNA